MAEFFRLEIYETIAQRRRRPSMCRPAWFANARLLSGRNVAGARDSRAEVRSSLGNAAAAAPPV